MINDHLLQRVETICACILLALMAMGCTANSAPQLASANVVAMLSGEVDEAFVRAYAPRPFEFPHDHGAHPEYQTEWWYYTGNLTDADGKRYGYQFTLFRSALTVTMSPRASDLAANQVYMAHFALTDVAANRHVSFERYSRGAGGLAGATGGPTFAVWLEDWRVHESEPGVMQVQAATSTADGLFAVDLILRETRLPLLHGDQGLSQKGAEAGNASYYYSLVGLETTGRVTNRGQTVEVSGVSWMDHEFGTSALSENAVGWDWFSLQLDNGAVLMFAQIRAADGGGLDDFAGTLVYPDGRQATIRPEDFVIAARSSWASPYSGISYPSGWRVEMPAFQIELEIEPLIVDQEMRVSFVYWEGAVFIRGRVDGVAVTGQGYVELTGYGNQFMLPNNPLSVNPIHGGTR